MLPDLCQDKTVKSVSDLTKVFAALHPETRRLFGEVEKYIRLCLAMPVSIANSERSFSNLRRLKTWLRQNMTQKRLTHLALMSIHSDILDTVDMNYMIRQFCLKTPERHRVFGI